MKGDLDGAIELVQKAIAAASPRDPESIAWAYTRLAGYELQRGRLGDAARAADSALSYQPDYAAALLMRGRVFLAMKKAADAVAASSRAAQLNPLPEYQWALGDALRLTVVTNKRTWSNSELTSRGAEADARTVALFLATRRAAVTKAVALAERELPARPRYLLARCACVAGRGGTHRRGASHDDRALAKVPRTAGSSCTRA